MFYQIIKFSFIFRDKKRVEGVDKVEYSMLNILALALSKME